MKPNRKHKQTPRHRCHDTTLYVLRRVTSSGDAFYVSKTQALFGTRSLKQARKWTGRGAAVKAERGMVGTDYEMVALNNIAEIEGMV